MVKALPQACLVLGQGCVDSATDRHGIDSAHGTFSFPWLYRLTNREFVVLKMAKRTEAKLLAAVAAGGLVLSPAFAATSSKHHPPAVTLSFDPLSTFTPAYAEPTLAAALSERCLSLSDFQFSPASPTGPA